MKRKNIIAVTLWAAVVLSLGACQNKGKEAEEKAGFEITVPDQLNGYEEKDISVMEKDMIQVQFSHGEEILYFRKGLTEKDGTDISGDYREADTFEKVKLGGRG